MIYHEIKTKEHYDILLEQFSVELSLEKFLISSSQIIVKRFNNKIQVLLSYGVKDGEVKIYYIWVDLQFRKQEFARTILAYLICKYSVNTLFSCCIRRSNVASINLFKSFLFTQQNLISSYPDGEDKLHFLRNDQQE